MKLNVVPESRSASSSSPPARGREMKTPLDGFALMLAQTSGPVEKQKPAAPARESSGDVEATANAARTRQADPNKPREVGREDDREIETGGDKQAVQNSDAAAAPAQPQTPQVIGDDADAAPVAMAASGSAAEMAVAETADAETAVAHADAEEGATNRPGAAKTTAADAKPAAPPAAVSADEAAGEIKPAAAPKPAARVAPSASADSQTAPAGDAKVMDNAPASAKAQAPPVSADRKAVPPLPAQDSAAPGAGAAQSSTGKAVEAAPAAVAPTTPAPSTIAVSDAPGAVLQPAPGAAPPPAAEQSVLVSRADSALPPPVVQATTLENAGPHLVRSVRLMVQGGHKTLTVRLIPEGLGELRVEVSALREGLHVRLMSANPAVREALESQLASLRETLAKSGVETNSVSVAAGSSGQTPQHMHADARRNEAAHGPGTQQNSTPDDAAPVPAGRVSTAHQGQLNIFV